MGGSVRGWRALSDGFLLQDVMAAGVVEASEKRDEPVAGEAVSPAARPVASRGWYGTAGAGALRQALLGGRDALMGWGGCAALC